MRIEVLSDNPGHMLQQAAADRRTAAGRVRAEREAALARVDELREARRQARREGRWLSWLRLVFAVSRAARAVPPPSVQHARPSDREEAIRAGRAGEQFIAQQLRGELDDAWMLFQGYRNSRGEIDSLLVGPRGVVAIEVKTVNAKISVTGDEWHYVKVDRYGNTVDSGFMADRKGRSPSQQLNEPAQALEQWLARHGWVVPVKRVVLLPHARSEVLATRGITVDAIGTSAGVVLRLLTSGASTSALRNQSNVEQLIRRDHNYHAHRRPTRKG